MLSRMLCTNQNCMYLHNDYSICQSSNVGGVGGWFHDVGFAVVGIAVDASHLIGLSIIKPSWFIYIKNIVNVHICDTLRS